MHEVSIVESMIELARQELKRSRLTGRVSSVSVAVGRLSGASPDSMQFAFEILSAPIPQLAGAVLRIDEPGPECRCRKCGFHGEVEGFTVECPRCGSVEIELVGGRDLRLVQIDIEDPEKQDAS